MSHTCVHTAHTEQQQQQWGFDTIVSDTYTSFTACMCWKISCPYAVSSGAQAILCSGMRA